MVFPLNLCIFKNWMTKIKKNANANADVTCEWIFTATLLGGHLFFTTRTFYYIIFFVFHMQKQEFPTWRITIQFLFGYG